MRNRYIKFQSEDKIDLLMHGTVYMKDLKYYVQLEREKQDDIVGDLFENAIKSEAYQMPSGLHCNLVLKNDFCRSFAFCMYKAYVNEDETIDFIHGDKLRSFGAYGLWIRDMDEFQRRIQKSVFDSDLVAGDVIYYDDLNEIPIEVMDSVVRTHTNAFCKRKKYEYQNEYRFVINKLNEGEINDDHIILDIGDISDISKKFKTEDLIVGKIKLI